MQSTSASGDALHVAIIMDGNGRWAEARRLPRAAGHRAGVEAVRRVVSAAPALGIGTLSLYALSSDNLKRPREEVEALFDLIRAYLDDEAARCARRDVRLTFFGRRDRLPADLLDSLARAESRTEHGRTLHLRIAVDYSGRDTIVRAASNAPGSRRAFGRALARAMNERVPAPAVDLLVRTGGERRLSDFLLYECAYAELVFLDRPWPEFQATELAESVAEFHRRERRFGALTRHAAS
jgi:undecaprenyl diphosphate synthase